MLTNTHTHGLLQSDGATLTYVLLQINQKCSLINFRANIEGKDDVKEGGGGVSERQRSRGRT